MVPQTDGYYVEVMANTTNLYIVIYNHRHGVDAWPIYRDEMPSSDDIIEELKASDEWDERDEADELAYVEVRGPFSVGENRL